MSASRMSTRKPSFLTLVGRALRGEQLTPAERGVYRTLKTLLFGALTAGLIAGVEYGNSLTTHRQFQMGNLVNAVMMAIGVSLLHGVQKWASANGQVGALLSSIVQHFTPSDPAPSTPITPAVNTAASAQVSTSISVPNLPPLPPPSLLDTAAQPTIPSLATVTGARGAEAALSARASNPTLAAMFIPKAGPISGALSPLDEAGKNGEKDAS